jgi:hypothetical protein
MVDRLVAVNDEDYRLPDPVMAVLTNELGSENGERPVGKNELLLNVLDFGAMGDSNVSGTTGTDDLSAIQAAAAAALAQNRTLWFPKVTNGYRSVGTVDLPGGIDVRMDSPVITPAGVAGVGLRYNATGPVANGRTLFLRQKRGAVTDWLSESDIGIQTRNVQRSRIVIAEVSNNTVGYQRLADNAGHVYNEITLLFINSNMVGLDCETTTSAGWVNEENLYGGNFTVGSTVHTNMSRIGVRIRSTPGYLNNAQVFHKPSFEIAVGITGGAEAIPILIANGINNRFHDVRNEGTPLLIRTTGVADGNFVSVTYGAAGATGDAIDDQGSYPTTVVRRSRMQHVEEFHRLVWETSDVHRRAFPYDATTVNIPGMVLVSASNATLSRALSGFTITPNYLETTSRHLGVQVNTSVVKRFVVAADCEPGFGGRVHVRCYDSAGAIMDPAAYTANPLVRGSSGRIFSATSGLGYTTGSDSGTPAFFSVSPSVASIVVCMTSGTAPLRIRAMRISADSVNVPAVYTPFPENLTEPVASTVPSTGTHTAGRRVYNGAPSSGAPIGWVCTAAGTPGTWASMGNLA